MGGSKLAEPRNAPRVDSRLFEICELLSQAGGVDFHPVLAVAKGKRGLACIGGGWAIEGADDPKQLRAAADLVSRLTAAEQEIASLCGEIVDRYEEATLVYRLSQRLATVEGEPSITRLVVDDAASTLAARAAELWLREDRQVRLAAAVPESSSQPLQLREHGPLAALEEGRPWIRTASSSHEAVVAVPLPGPENRPLGVLVLRGGATEREFSSGNVKLITVLAALASAFIRNARLVRTREQPGTVADLAGIESIRRELRAGNTPAVPGLQLADGTLRGSELGTDFFAYLTRPDGSIALAIANNSSSGPGAAMRMAAARGAIQAEARRTGDPAELVRHVHEALSADLVRADSCISAFVARIHPGRDQVEYCNAGHNPPLLLHGSDPVEMLEPGGAALGVLGSAGYSTHKLDLSRGDVLLLYTDAVVDSRNASGRPYGVDRLRQVASNLAGRSAQQLVDGVLEDLRTYRGSSPCTQDATLLVARFEKEVREPTGEEEISA